jgi:hypothetical protein
LRSRAREDGRSVNLISDVLAFGRLWYDTADHAIGYAMQYSRSADTVVRVYDARQRDRDARALIAKHVFGLPICLGAGQLLCQVVLSIGNSFRALVLRNKAQFQELMQVD